MFRKKWFSSNPSFSFLTVFIQSTVCRKIFFMKRVEFVSSLVCLTHSSESIFSRYSKSCRNEIRRALTLDFVFRVSQPSHTDFLYFKKCFSSMNLKAPSVSYFTEDSSCFIAEVLFRDTIIAKHLYLSTTNLKYIRLVYSAISLEATTFIHESISNSRLLGLANRLLHHHAIHHFKTLGHVYYDFGGVAMTDTDIKLLNINKFKRSFGGLDVVYFNYYPLLFTSLKFLYFLTSFRKITKPLFP